MIQDESQVVVLDSYLRDGIASENPSQGGAAVRVFRDQGSYALVSAAHTVLPGERLTIDLGGDYNSFQIMNTMAYSFGTSNYQVRIDAYDASTLQYPDATSWKPAVFDTTDIAARPFLGNLLSAVEIQTSNVNWHTLTADLSPYAGKTIYIAFRVLVPLMNVGVLIALMSFASQERAQWNALCYLLGRCVT